MIESKKFKSGEMIFRENTWEMKMYEIKSGSVGVYVNYGTEKQQKLTDLAAGRRFGEMGLIEARMRSATVVALEDTEVDVIDAEGLSEYFKNSPEKVMEILQQMSSRLRELSDDYKDTCAVITEYVNTDKELRTRPGLLERIASILEEAAKYDQELIDMGCYNYVHGYWSGYEKRL